MRESPRHIAGLAALLFVVALLSAPAAACPVSRGAQLVLVSQELDPDVFLWDSVDRLIKYATGDYNVEMVLKHTTLIRAYSRAVALGCKNATIRPSYAAKEDATVYIVGVRIASGRARGHNGWVLSSDVRGPDGRLLTTRGATGGRPQP